MLVSGRVRPFFFLRGSCALWIPTDVCRHPQESITRVEIDQSGQAKSMGMGERSMGMGFQRLPGTQMTLVLIGKGLVFGGLTFKNRGHLGSRYIWDSYFFLAKKDIFSFFTRVLIWTHTWRLKRTLFI